MKGLKIEWAIRFSVHRSHGSGEIPELGVILSEVQVAGRTRTQRTGSIYRAERGVEVSLVAGGKRFEMTGFDSYEAASEWLQQRFAEAGLSIEVEP